MKKQVFILVIVFIASMDIAWGQEVQQVSDHLTANATAVTVNSLTCSGTTGVAPELEPIAGNQYTYTVNVTPSSGTTYRWFVTNETTFIDATNGLKTTGADPGNGTGNYILAVGTIANYNNASGTSNTIDIKWKSFTTDPVFLVIYSTSPTTGCADNIQAWKITPRNGFTLDLANLGIDGSNKGTSNLTTCVSSIQSATWDGTAKKITMDYGVNYLYYGVAAANYGDAWKPSVQLTLPTNYETDRTIAVEWAYAADATGTTAWHTMSGSGGIYTSTDYAKTNAYAKKSNPSATDDGNQIVIRVKVDHNNKESIADAVIALAVDGEMFGDNGSGLASQGFDVAVAAWTNPTTPYTGVCGTPDGYDNDHVQQTIKARPNITETNPATTNGAFIPKQ